MIKKITILLTIFCLSACGFFIDRSDDCIGLKSLTDFGNNTGNLIRLSVLGKNFPRVFTERCEEFSDFALTYSVNIKAPSVRIQGAHPEFEFVKNGVTKGRFKINKSDIYLLHQNQKFYPTIYWREYEYDTIESASVSYLNYKRYGTLYAKFDLPCTKLLDPGTKLVISKIYKDDKVIQSNIEFGFVKSSDNQGYSIWLE